MEDLIIGFAKSAPGLGAALIIVYFFLKAMDTRDKRQLEHESRREANLASIADACHTVQRDAITVMGEVREELGATRAVNTEMLAYLREGKAG